MKISLPIDIWDPRRGGAEAYLCRLGQALTERGHEVTILCLAARGEGLPARVLPVPRFPRWLRELSFAHRSLRAHKRSGRDVLFAVRHALEADVYQPHGGSFRAARRAASRALGPFMRRADACLAPLRLTRRVLFWLDRQVFLRSPEVLTVSVSAKVEDDLRRTYPDLSFHFRRIHNALDAERFHDRDREACSRELRTRWGISGESRIAAFVAHKFRAKGLSHAIGTIQKAPRWHLVVAGRDHSRAFAEEAFRRGVAERVHFLGDVGEPRALHAGSDALLLPTYYDPCSMAVLEALACGTPVVTTRHNGASELLEAGRSGFIIEEPDDEAAAARALSSIDDGWPAFHEAASRSAKRFSWKEHVDSMENVFLEAVEIKREREKART